MKPRVKGCHEGDMKPSLRLSPSLRRMRRMPQAYKMNGGGSQ